jgi:DNA-binding transcriptional ArsR family regulator
VSAGRARKLDDAFGALADPTRRQVVELLSKAPQRASDLATALEASRPGMSRHLRILREAGFIREEEDAVDARARIYSIEPTAFASVKDWLSDVEAFWCDQLASFKVHVEARAAAKSKRSSKS